MEQQIISEGVNAVDEFERALVDQNLQFERLSLKKYKDCIHWHIRQPGSKGTLEATYLPESQRLWLEIRPGRTAPWLASVVANLERLFEVLTPKETT